MKLSHITLNVKNLEESLHYYKNVLGLPIKARFSPDADREIVFLGNEGETAIELIFDSSKIDSEFELQTVLGFSVESLQETREKFEQYDIPLGELIKPNPQIEFFYTTDPDGQIIQFSKGL